MYIIDKLKQQIQTTNTKYNNLVHQNNALRSELNALKNQIDKMKYNNENMLLNIDKALFISKKDEHDAK